MKKTLGGQRIGSGNKMNVHLHNYERSTHNLSRDWRSSMSAGTLVPFFTEIGLNGDTFDIDLEAAVKTKPTVAPLFGSFKLQLDVFTIPFRLYNGLLHNNALKLGLDMKKVLIPKINLKQLVSENENTHAFSSSSLMTYLGVRGIGNYVKSSNPAIPALTYQVQRDFNAIPVLAYFDIFKNYYANKQEDNAYIIGPSLNYEKNKLKISSIKITKYDLYPPTPGFGIPGYEEEMINNPTSPITLILADTVTTSQTIVEIKGKNLSVDDITINGTKLSHDNDIYISVNRTDNITIIFPSFTTNLPVTITMAWEASSSTTKPSGLALNSFPISNIDDMRMDILRMTDFNSAITLNEHSPMPYKQVTSLTENKSNNEYNQNGLLVKTYQSDIFNNWLNTDWIDGPDGIAAVTTIDTSAGLNLDALNLAQKVYNMLNRIAVSGGSYEDWQEAVYGEDAIRRAESPIYEGGMAAEIVFEEIVSSAETETTEGGNQALGTLAGKGTIIGKRGGNITIKIKEPSLIMGIVSITPRIDYSQGNKWFMTELDTMDDLHKPALDGIGFQELITENMAWWATNIQDSTHGTGIYNITKTSAGKQPAWLHYMTSYNEVYGDFTEENKAAAMVLTRRYEKEIIGNVLENKAEIKDLTTYIDPTKFNYAFSDATFESQNFWVQIASKVIARRKMSAKQIPNL